MSSSRKKLVKSFYTSGFFKGEDELREYIHPEVELFWNSSQGFNKMGFSDLAKMSSEMAKSYESLRTEISHLIKEKNTICIRFTYYVRTVENPDEEITVAHFMAIWETKDGKMYKGYQISLPADETPENLSSFLSTNF